MQIRQTTEIGMKQVFLLCAPQNYVRPHTLIFRMHNHTECLSESTHDTQIEDKEREIHKNVRIIYVAICIEYHEIIFNSCTNYSLTVLAKILFFRCI